MEIKKGSTWQSLLQISPHKRLVEIFTAELEKENTKIHLKQICIKKRRTFHKKAFAKQFGHKSNSKFYDKRQLNSVTFLDKEIINSIKTTYQNFHVKS